MFRSAMRDVPASVVVFFIALPLSLGIALASGAPLKAGLIAAVAGGIVVGFLGGAPLQVSGPAAGLTVMVADIILKFGFEAACVVTIVAGVTQIILAVIGADRLTKIVPSAVIHAMLAGIGILISLGQLHVLLGSKPQGSAIANIAAIPQSIMGLNGSALFLGLLTIAIIQLWPRYVPSKLRLIPGSLVAVCIGTALSLILPMDVRRVTLGTQVFSFPTLPHLEGVDLTAVFLAAVALALVATTESLLCAVATDKLHTGVRANLRRELAAQGVGNVTSGFLGGLPITGVIVRSSANISAGATSRASAIMHGLWILIFVTFFSTTIAQIPLPVLAGLLICVGVGLVKLKAFLKTATPNEVLAYVVTVLGVVFTTLLWGIGFGFLMTFILEKMTRLTKLTRKTS